MSIQFVVDTQQIATKTEKEKEARKKEKRKEERREGRQREKGERKRTREQRTFIHKGIKVTITTKIESLL